MRILVVEDELKIANPIKRGLEQEGYFAVDIAVTGLQALDMVESEPYDLIILDVMLPEMSGFDVCTQIRAEKHTMPILILSAKGQPNDKVTGLDLGADDYLAKPFAFSELLARIKALLRRPQQLTTEVLTYADLTLNLGELTCKRGETSIQLSAKEFAVLRFFLDHAEKIVTKEQILSNAWNYDADVLINTVEATVKNLRKKIEAPFPDKPRLIQTVRGYGYTLQADNV